MKSPQTITDIYDETSPLETSANTTFLSTASILFPNGSYQSKLYVGMALALGGNLLISVSLSVQKKAHNRLGQDSQTKYCLDKWWWLGMILMVFGEIGNFMAYGFAPASLVAPLGSVAVIANTLIAALFLHEPLTMPSIMGVSLVVVGAVTLVNFSPMSKPTLTSMQIVKYLEAWPFLLYISLEAILLAILLYVKYKKRNEHVIILLLLVAIVASVTIISAKALSTLLSESILQGRNHILNPVFWISLLVLPISAVIQIRFLNRAMQLYDVSDVVPINFIFFTLSAILVGVLFYQEFYGLYFDRIFMFIFGCLQSFIGVAIITQQKEYKNKNNAENIHCRDENSKDFSPLINNISNSQVEAKKEEDTDKQYYSDLPSTSKTCSFLNPLGGASGLLNLNSLIGQRKITRTQGFFSDFVKSVKSTENLLEVQPLLRDARRTQRQ